MTAISLGNRSFSLPASPLPFRPPLPLLPHSFTPFLFSFFFASLILILQFLSSHSSLLDRNLPRQPFLPPPLLISFLPFSMLPHSCTLPFFRFSNSHFPISVSLSSFFPPYSPFFIYSFTLSFFFSFTPILRPIAFRNFQRFYLLSSYSHSTLSFPLPISSLP